MLGLLTLLLLSLLSVLAGPSHKACTERLDIPSTNSCCRLSDLNVKPFEKKCGHLMIEGLYVWPCSFECIFKAAGVLNGTQFDLGKINQLLNELFQDQQQMKDRFTEGFVKCKAKEEEIVKTIKRRRFSDKAKCSPLAMLFGVCAYKYVFTNCPDDNWTNSSMCHRIRACELSKST